VERAVTYPVDVSPCPVLSTPMSQICPLVDQP